MNESVNAVVKAISTVATEMVNVQDEYKPQMVAVVKTLAEVLEQVTRIPQGVKTVEVAPVKEETVNVGVPVLPEPEVVEEPSESASSSEEEVCQSPRLKKGKRWNGLKYWLNSDVEHTTITGKPELREQGEKDVVDTVVTDEARQHVFGNAKTVEVHFPVWRELGKRSYVTETVAELPVEDLMTRKWTRERVSNNHKRWVQTYQVEGGKSFSIAFGMCRIDGDSNQLSYELQVSRNPNTKYCERLADGRLVLASVLDGNFDLGYDTKTYTDGIIEYREDYRRFATACGVQTVWDARNLKN